ncbi:amino acid-binding protein [Methanobrevibacter sp.]|uniref:amino acid-binding protein n=1 Tax=Methanobrevibacter sp. TaxID=66852 RepID=UPI00388E877B
MWESLNLKFSKYPARMAVASKMFELGLRISDDGKIYCGDLKISDSALAVAANVDRRVIKSTVDVIIADKELYDIFSNIIPAGTLLKNIAKNLNLGVIEIEAGERSEGVLAKVAWIMSKHNINIRQAYAGDTQLNTNPVLTIITEDSIPGELLKEFIQVDGVLKVSIL